MFEKSSENASAVERSVGRWREESGAGSTLGGSQGLRQEVHREGLAKGLDSAWKVPYKSSRNALKTVFNVQK